MKNMEQLKNQWKKELYLNLYDEFEQIEYYGYNNVKPLFDRDYVLEFKLSDKLYVQLKNSNLPHATVNYSDEWFIYGEYENETIRDKYNLIWNIKEFQELRKYVVEFYENLSNEVSKFIYNFEMENDYIDNEVIRDFINTYLNEKLN